MTLATKEKTLSLKAFLDTNGFTKPLAEMKKELDDAGRDFKVAASEAKAFGTKTDELNTRAKHLRDTIEKQDKVVKTLVAAYLKSKAETGANSKATEKLADEVAKAKIKYNNLNSELKSATQEMKDNEDATKKNTGGIAKWIETGLVAGGTAGLISAGLDIVKSGFSMVGDFAGGAFGVIKQGSAIALSGIEALSKAIGSMVINSASAADDAMTMGAKMGLTAQQVMELQYASELVDVDLETMAGSLSRLTMGVGKAAKEQRDYNTKLVEAHKNHKRAKPVLGDTATAFGTLKVKLTDGKGALRDMNDVWADTITALGTVKNETQRDILAQKLFGKSFAELKPLVAAGGKALKDLAKEARANGYVMSNEQLAALGGLDDSYQKFLKTMDGVKNFMSAELAPGFTALLDAVVKNAPMLEKELAPALKNVGDAFISIVDAVTPHIPEMADGAKSIINSIASGLKEAAPSIEKIAEKAPTLFNGIATAFSLMPEGTIVKFADFAANGFSDLSNAVITSAPSFVDIISTLADNAEGMGGLITTIAENAPTLVRDFSKLAEVVLPAIAAWGPPIIDMLTKTIGMITMITDFIAGGSYKQFFDNTHSVPGPGDMGGEDIPSMATGGKSQGGLTLVGERGPELTILPRGARVFSNSDTRKILEGSKPREVHHTGTVRHEIVGADGMVQYIKEQVIDDWLMEVRMA